MKKIFLFVASVCALVACDPVQEDFSNAGHISAEELKAKTTVKLVAIDEFYSNYKDYLMDGKSELTEEQFDALTHAEKQKAFAGDRGNVVVCETLAPVNAKWNVAGKEYTNNYAQQKLKLGDQMVVLTALCADGTVISAEYPLTVDTISNKLTKYYIYGEPGSGQEPFTPGAWDAAQMRFSDNEGKHFPYISDDIYWGFKTLIIDASNAVPGNQLSVMNGWWSAFYAEGIEIKDGAVNEIPLTEAIAKDCARGNGGSGKDLQLMFKSGTAQINSVYYEE